MTLETLHRPVDPRGPRSGAAGTGRPTAAVEVLVCGSPDRGDDGAAVAAAHLLHPRLPEDVEIRIVGQLDVDDLLSVRRDAVLIIVDAATGIEPGRVVVLPLGALTDGSAGWRPRSSHALEAREVLGLAALFRDAPLRGRIVAIGGERFDLGSPLSDAVRTGLPRLVDAVATAIEAARE